MSDDFYSEILWQLPDDQMYTIQHREKGASTWYSTNEFNTRQKMKERLSTMPDHKDHRVVRVSKYPPHSVVEVIFYREAQR
jgi:hypothetical protein